MLPDRSSPERKRAPPLPFPDERRLVSELPVDVLSQFVEAAKQHALVGDTEHVGHQLHRLPDQELAATIAIEVGTSCFNTEILGFAKVLNPDERVIQEADARIEEVVLAQEEEARRYQDGVDVAESDDAQNVPSVVLYDQENQSSEPKNAASLSEDDVFEGLKRLNTQIAAGRSDDQIIEAKLEYDRALAGYVALMFKQGNVDFAQEIALMAKTGRGRAAIPREFDALVAAKIRQLAIAGELDSAQDLIPLSLTDPDNCESRRVFELQVLVHIDNACRSGNVSDAGKLTKYLDTTQFKITAQSILVKYEIS